MSNPGLDPKSELDGRRETGGSDGVFLGESDTEAKQAYESVLFAAAEPRPDLRILLRHPVGPPMGGERTWAVQFRRKIGGRGAEPGLGFHERQAL